MATAKNCNTCNQKRKLECNQFLTFRYQKQKVWKETHIASRMNDNS